MRTMATVAALMLVLAGCKGADGTKGSDGAAGAGGAAGPTGPTGPTGPNGAPGSNAVDKGTIAGTVLDAAHAPVAAVTVATVPASVTATTSATGAFTLANVPVGGWTVTASKAGFATSTLSPVGVAGGVTTNVSLSMTVDSAAPATISGTVTNSKVPPGPVAGATVAVQGQSATATTSATGTFTLSGVAPGPVFLTVVPADLTKLLPTENRNAIFVAPASALTGVALVVSARPSDAATYVGLGGTGVIGCSSCHGPGNTVTGDKATPMMSAAHYRSLARIARDGSGLASAGAWTRLLNPTLTNARTVMIPLPGTIVVPTASAVVTGTGTLFQSGGAGVAVQVGDKLGYTPVGLGWTQLGVIASLDSDTQVTLAANAVFANGVTSLPAPVNATGTAYSVARLSSTGHAKMWPDGGSDIVAPAWPGVKATSPNYDANDPCIYAAPTSGTCAAGGTAKYSDGQINVYLCNLKGLTIQGVTYANDEYVQKFGGKPYTCTDGTFWDGTTTPTVPLVHIDVVYGGQGDKDGGMAKHQNVGVFKQRFQGRLADVKVTTAWTYTSAGDRARDSLTLPIQILESGDKVNGGFKMNGYHPTEQKFPGESWTQKTRTFSHACAGCHATGMVIAWDTETINLAVPREGGVAQMTNASIKAYSYKDENITCEHCHGPGSEHVAAPGKGSAIINPKYLTAESERQVCGACHTYDDATNAKPAQTYGFEYPWNSDYAAKVGNGGYVPGVYGVNDFYDNFGEMGGDGEAFWDPARTGGKLYGQAHRQQNAMLSFSKHTNNAFEKLTCTTCHDAHSTYRVTPTATSFQGDAFKFVDADYRNNVSCLSCHAGYGPFTTLTKADVAARHAASGGTFTKNGAAVVLDPQAQETSIETIAAVVSQHMADKARMPTAYYDPTNDAMPVGRCTSCHMPKVAKSGGYTTGLDPAGNEALVEGDQASHTFEIIWPWQSNAMSMSGPTFQSGYYGQTYTASNTTKYDKFGYMPNSCNKCHDGARRPSQLCPDTATVWPTYWPLNDFTVNPNMGWITANCFTSKAAP